LFYKYKKNPDISISLFHYDPSAPTRVYNDAAQYDLGGVILQKDPQTVQWKALAYDWRKFTDAEEKIHLNVR